MTFCFLHNHSREQPRFFCRASGFNITNHNTNPRFNSKLFGIFFREFFYCHAQQFYLFESLSRLRQGFHPPNFLWTFIQLQFQKNGFSIPDQFHFNFSESPGVCNFVAQMVTVLDQFVIDSDHDISFAHASFLSWSILHNSSNQATFGTFQLKSFSQIMADILDSYSQPTPGNNAFIYQVPHDFAGHIYRHRKTNALIAAALTKNCAVDSDNFTTQTD